MTKLINISEFEVPQRAGNLVLEEYTKLILRNKLMGLVLLRGSEEINKSRLVC